jgi:hypothetical protein
MKIFIFVIFLTGCANWKVAVESSLTTVHKATKEVSNVIEPKFDRRCSSIAQQCKAVDDKICKPLANCEKQFKAVNKAIMGVHVAIAAGKSLLALSNEKEAKKAAQKAVAELGKLYYLAKKYEVFEWKK